MPTDTIPLLIYWIPLLSLVLATVAYLAVARAAFADARRRVGHEKEEASRNALSALQGFPMGSLPSLPSSVSGRLESISRPAWARGVAATEALLVATRDWENYQAATSGEFITVIEQVAHGSLDSGAMLTEYLRTLKGDSLFEWAFASYGLFDGQSERLPDVPALINGDAGGIPEHVLRIDVDSLESLAALELASGQVVALEGLSTTDGVKHGEAGRASERLQQALDDLKREIDIAFGTLKEGARWNLERANSDFSLVTRGVRAEVDNALDSARSEGAKSLELLFETVSSAAEIALRELIERRDAARTSFSPWAFGERLAEHRELVRLQHRLKSARARRSLAEMALLASWLGIERSELASFFSAAENDLARAQWAVADRLRYAAQQRTIEAKRVAERLALENEELERKISQRITGFVDERLRACEACSTEFRKLGWSEPAAQVARIIADLESVKARFSGSARAVSNSA